MIKVFWDEIHLRIEPLIRRYAAMALRWGGHLSGQTKPTG